MWRFEILFAAHSVRNVDVPRLAPIPGIYKGPNSWKKNAVLQSPVDVCNVGKEGLCISVFEADGDDLLMHSSRYGEVGQWPTQSEGSFFF